MTLRLYSCVLLAALAAIANAAEPQNPLGLRTYTQTLTIEFATPEEAAAAELSPLPVFGGKALAFSARWDDNRPTNGRMRELMTKLGLRGTFYINKSDAGRSFERLSVAYAKNLSTGGCTVGSHTLTHDVLTGLLPNEIFYEIAANKIERECETDQVINSFAPPFNRVQDRSNPDALKWVTQSVLRSGIHNTPLLSQDFGAKNPFTLPHELSTAHETRPGDKEVDAAKYDKRIESLTRDHDKTIQTSHCLYFGIHAAYQGEGWNDIEKLLTRYANRTDWWYCNMNEYAAYHRQFYNTVIGAGPIEGKSRRFRITRPLPSELGDLVPLSVAVEKGGVVSAYLNEKPLEASSILNLPHDSGSRLPALIDVANNLTNATEAPADLKRIDVDVVKAWLVVDLAKQELRLTIQNTAAKPILGVTPTFRLPPIHSEGVRRMAAFDLKAGESRILTMPLGDYAVSPDLRGGRAYYIAEIDFSLDSQSARLYATTLLPAAPATVACVRDAAQMIGPMAVETDWSAMGKLSVVGASLIDLGDTAEKQWFCTSDADRGRWSPNAVTLFRNDKPWKAAAGKFSYKEQAYAVAIDFRLSAASSVKIQMEGKLLGTWMNGATVEPQKPFSGQAGLNRMIVVVSLKDGRTSWSAWPVTMKLEPAAGELSYVAQPPSPVVPDGAKVETPE